MAFYTYILYSTSADLKADYTEEKISNAIEKSPANPAPSPLERGCPQDRGVFMLNKEQRTHP